MAEKLPRRAEDLSIWPDAQKMIEKARRDNVETVWDRLAEQRPACTFCKQGLSCSKCVMGPCRITPGKGKRERGVCGADADLTVARNFGRFVAAGAASHSDHGRDLVETLLAVGQGKTSDYGIRDPEKLRRIAAEVGVTVQGKSDKEIARALAETFIEDFGFATPSVSFVARVPGKRRELWEKLGITPRGIDRDVVEMMHRTHMGVDSDAVSLCLHSARVALGDGWGGSMIATELSDILFGTPTPRKAQVNLGVLKADQVNVVVHGHSPIVSEMILAAARDPELIRKAKSSGASGINVAGLCCTGNEVLMRQGIPMAGNHLMTELALVTGAVDCIVVDYQCIMPSLVTIAGCYQTRFISTSDKAKFTGAEHVEFNYANARQKAVQVVEAAIEAFTKRDPGRVDIPAEPVELMTGFSNEAILGALGGTPGPLLEAIKAGQIRGAVGIVGCNNPRLKHDHVHTELCKELIRRDILVLITGCATVAMGKAGLMVPEAADRAGEGLKAVCTSLGIPPVLHVGSCVDNSRIIHLCAMLADALGTDISDLPVAASAPEWYSEKAAAIGLYAVASGIYTHLGLPPHITGSETVTNLALSGLEGVVGACFGVEADPHKAAEAIDARISAKRQSLGLTP
ncbi:anaerobic carbon-monoxide dehydrogenase catalytic subunit [Desulfonatronum lacustre]|uniref:anaerobic carbon-monoxide dehydrogenase catalytic subunit n=1 Tax=Desulfonatronum lacustre TaxID=66849 RepID=UPI00048C108F|nr:anaerobic carbon-monoxide dehydrogenase catalytic subunit [Desulfonatronum lacustre]